MHARRLSLSTCSAILRQVGREVACGTAITTPEALAARRARERASARGCYCRLPVDRQAALVARWDATTRRDYQLTREQAAHHRQR